MLEHRLTAMLVVMFATAAVWSHPQGSVEPEDKPSSPSSLVTSSEKPYELEDATDNDWDDDLHYDTDDELLEDSQALLDEIDQYYYDDEEVEYTTSSEQLEEDDRQKDSHEDDVATSEPEGLKRVKRERLMTVGDRLEQAARDERRLLDINVARGRPTGARRRLNFNHHSPPRPPPQPQPRVQPPNQPRAQPPNQPRVQPPNQPRANNRLNNIMRDRQNFRRP